MNYERNNDSADLDGAGAGAATSDSYNRDAGSESGFDSGNDDLNGINSGNAVGENASYRDSDTELESDGGHSSDPGRSDGDEDRVIATPRKRGRPAGSGTKSKRGKSSNSSTPARAGTGARDEERESEEDSPRIDFDFSSLFSGDELKGPLLGSLLDMPLQLLFEAPMLFGAGDYWPLDPVEQKILSKALKNAINSLPAAQKKKWIQFEKKKLPWLSLIAVAVILTKPRLQMLREEYRNARNEKKANTIQRPTHQASEQSVREAGNTTASENDVSRFLAPSSGGRL